MASPSRHALKFPSKLTAPRPTASARKREWQRARLQSDLDYRINQRAAQQAWSDRNQGYWRDYRDARPEYAQRNREQQWSRDQAGNTDLAKMDVCEMLLHRSRLPARVPSGRTKKRELTGQSQRTVKFPRGSVTEMAIQFVCFSGPVQFLNRNRTHVRHLGHGELPLV